MADLAADGAARPPVFSDLRSWSAAELVVAAGAVALVLPTLWSLARYHWSTSDGAHGPIILVSGLWLLFRGGSPRFRPGSIATGWLALGAPLLLLILYARTFRLLGLEAAAVFATLLLLGLFYWGPQAIRNRWVPIAYLAFLIKPPDLVVIGLTQPLKIMISQVAVAVLHAAGYPVAGSGVLIQVAQYELLVQQACAGLGSLLTLLAMGMIYVYLTRPPSRTHVIALLLSIVPIAVLANLLRVIILVLLTYHVGDGVAQSFAHDMAGMFTFVMAMLGMLLVDTILDRWHRQPQ
ncbi:exosortase [Sphingomonas sp. BN140010]|uniref:Exosortase n=1 Tax=Sphingomonas arvum TaxID=2992113 RepID=A0ABT3JCC0_9SPHN|nr:exosortase [Sphingomonas sp. BN140010]MCW3796564.1 exosortase [Sphingomonas sp. BN140010]